MSQTELLIGDLAPPLKLGEILKGEEVTHFVHGRIYLVECWATWCGPCVATIPHLTKLQATYPDVTVIGIAVWENDVEAVRAFVAEKGAEMDYTVATDDPGNGEDDQGWMPRAWLGPSYQDGIPAAFLVDREGRVVWFGHPDGVDEVLPQVVSGTFDLPAAAEAYRTFLGENMVRESTAMMRDIDRHMGADDPASALRAIDAAFAAHPRLETLSGLDKLLLLLRTDPGAAIAYSQDLVDRVSPDDAILAMEAGRLLIETAETTEDATAARALAVRSLEMLQAAAGRETDQASPFLLMQLSRNLARALIACERAGEARAHAEAALDAAIAAETLPAEFVAGLRALVEKCASQPAQPKPKAAPVIVCDGETCRIVA